jgi:hypothetical protein
MFWRKSNASCYDAYHPSPLQAERRLIIRAEFNKRRAPARIENIDDLRVPADELQSLAPRQRPATLKITLSFDHLQALQRGVQDQRPLNTTTPESLMGFPLGMRYGKQGTEINLQVTLVDFPEALFRRLEESGQLKSFRVAHHLVHLKVFASPFLNFSGFVMVATGTCIAVKQMLLAVTA